MNTRIEYDLRALRESTGEGELLRLPHRYAVLGAVRDVRTQRLRPDDIVHETDDLHDARIVCDLERHCSGINGYDSAIIWDRFMGREIPFATSIARRSAA